MAVVAVVAICGAACIPAVEPPDVVGPQGQSDLAVAATTETPSVTEGASVTLDATASGGTPPYRYRWDQNAGPRELDVDESEVTSATMTVGTFDVVGRYVFRVVVTDDGGFITMAFVTVEVEAGLTVAVETADAEVFQGTTATLNATTEGGTAPITFLWSQASGPEDVDLTAPASAALETPPFVAAGQYVFQVTATDTEGFTATADVSVAVVPAVTVDPPEFAIANEPVELPLTIETNADGLTFLWEVVAGSAAFDDPSAQSPLLTTDADETVELRLSVMIPVENGEAVTTTQEFQVVSIVEDHPRVLVETSLGDFTIELDRAAAPLHTANFLLYTDTGFYTGTLFHRIACTLDVDAGECVPFVAQGGGYERVDGELALKEATRDPVPSEAAGQTSLSRYDVALALSGGDPDSGSTQFFISLRDLNDFQNVEDFTVFGRVVEGSDVIDALTLEEVTDSTIIPGEVSLPVDDVIILGTARVEP